MYRYNGKPVSPWRGCDERRSPPDERVAENRLPFPPPPTH